MNSKRWTNWLVTQSRSRIAFATASAVFLIGGALFSAVRYSRDVAQRQRAVGNVLIALGAILPGIGGTATRMGHTEVLYVTELIGLIVIALGYRLNVRASAGGNARTPEPQRSWKRSDRARPQLD